MGISSYLHILSQPTTEPKRDVLGLAANGKVVARKPLGPLGTWTRFKGALSRLPVLGRISELGQAGAQVANHAVARAEYQADNREIAFGLLRDLRSEFGPEIADMTAGTLNVQGAAPLSLSKLSTALKYAKDLQANCKVHNNMQVASFLEIDALFPDEQDMTDVYVGRGGNCSWQAGVGLSGAKFLRQYIQARCEELPEYAKAPLSNQQIVAAANEAFALYEELAAVPGMTPPRLRRTLDRAAGQRSALQLANTVREAVAADRRSHRSFLSSEASGQRVLTDLPGAKLEASHSPR